MIAQYFSWGLFGVLLLAVALVHYIRRQPSGYWLWVILFLLPPLGALIYVAVEILPELFDPGAFHFFERNRRLHQLKFDVRQNPSPGNYEELGLLLLDKQDWRGARACFDRAIAQRDDSVDSLYRRGLAAVGMEDFAAARADLERVVLADAGYDFQRAAGLLAFCDWQTGNSARARRLFEQVLRTSTLTETQLHYAEFLAAQGERETARQWIARLYEKRPQMPGFQRRRERKLFRRAAALRRRL